MNEQPFSERRWMYQTWDDPQGIFNELVCAEIDDLFSIIETTTVNSPSRITAMKHHKNSFFAHGEF